MLKKRGIRTVVNIVPILLTDSEDELTNYPSSSKTIENSAKRSKKTYSFFDQESNCRLLPKNNLELPNDLFSIRWPFFQFFQDSFLWFPFQINFELSHNVVKMTFRNNNNKWKLSLHCIWSNNHKKKVDNLVETWKMIMLVLLGIQNCYLFVDYLNGYLWLAITYLIWIM